MLSVRANYELPTVVAGVHFRPADSRAALLAVSSRSRVHQQNALVKLVVWFGVVAQTMAATMASTQNAACGSPTRHVVAWVCLVSKHRPKQRCSASKRHAERETGPTPVVHSAPRIFNAKTLDQKSRVASNRYDYREVDGWQITTSLRVACTVPAPRSRNTTRQQGAVSGW